MNSLPLVSVIIPVYNGELYLAQSIESILSQQKANFELIIVDDGSTDQTAAVVKTFASCCRYHYQPRLGAAAARNKGVKLAQGSFLAFNDADDEWTPDKLFLQMQAFNLNPQLDMAFGYVKNYLSPELSAQSKNKISCPENALPGYNSTTMLIKHSSFLSVGFFSEKWKLGEFVDWFSRAVEKNLTHFIIPQVLLNRRLHENNQGRQERHFYPDYAKILKQSLDRRRQSCSV